MSVASALRSELTPCVHTPPSTPPRPAGYSVQALSTGEGALGSLAKFADNLNN